MNRLLPVLLLAGCSVSHGVRPLPRGTGALTASLGGPISGDLPTPIPFIVPITTVGYAHGLTNRTTVHGAVHPTGLAAFGVFGVDAGAAVELVGPAGAAPRLMLDSDLVFYAGDNASGGAKGGALLLPSVELVASWDLGHHALYAGANELVQPFPSVRQHLTPLAGALFSFRRTDLQLEYKWMQLTRDNTLVAAEWVGPFGQGASAIQLGLSIHLGKGHDS